MEDAVAADVFESRRDGRSPRRELIPVVAAVSAGGALGAGARYAATLSRPTAQAAFPATTLAVNVFGSALIGILMVSVVQLWPHRRLVRLFLGTGVLGGFTTFSTYAVDVQQLATAGQVGMAAAYLLLTPILAVLAATLTARATGRVITWRSA
ncbi:MAG: fluoride efflux transporter CrcB [Dermatophilaceae bacterium]